MGTRVLPQKLDQGVGEKFEVFFRRQAPDMPNHKGILRNVKRCANVTRLAGSYPVNIYARRNNHGLRLDILRREKVCCALARRNNRTTKVAIPKGQTQREALCNFRVFGDVVPIKLVICVVGVNYRNITRRRHSKRRPTQ